MTALMNAVNRQDAAQVQELLRQGADPNARVTLTELVQNFEGNRFVGAVVDD